MGAARKGAAHICAATRILCKYHRSERCETQFGIAAHWDRHGSISMPVFAVDSGFLCGRPTHNSITRGGIEHAGDYAWPDAHQRSGGSRSTALHFVWYIFFNYFCISPDWSYICEGRSAQRDARESPAPCIGSGFFAGDFVDTSPHGAKN
eukprot:4097755-Pleurochrysis_carterae.AAC.3